MSASGRTLASAPARSGVARVLLALASSALLLLAPGCSEPGEEVCTAYCDCVDCSEDEREVCLAEQSAEADIASVYDCDAELEDYQGCVEVKAKCNAGAFNVAECQPEADEYQTCKD